MGKNSTTENSSPGRHELTLHFLYSFFLMGGISFVMVYLPLVLREANYSPKEIGFLLSAFNFVGLAAILLFGRLLDAWRCYRPLILGGLFISALAFSRLFFLQNIYGSLVVIIILAIGFLPQVSLMDSYISLRYQEIPQYYGRIRSLGSVGYVFFLGLIARLFDPYDPLRLQFWVFALFGLMALLFWGSSLDSVPRIRAAAKTPATTGTPAEIAKEFVGEQRNGIQTLGWPLIILLLLLVVCWALIMGVNPNFLALFLSEELQVKNVSPFFIVATASEIPIIFWGGRILYRRPLGWMLLLAFSAALLRLLLYAALPLTAVILLGQLLHSVAYGLFHIAIIAIINRYFTKYRGMAIAIYASMPTLSNAIGAMFGGILIQKYGFSYFFWIFLLLVLPILIPIYLLRRRFLCL